MIRRFDRYLLFESFVPALIGVVMLLLLLIGNALYQLLRVLYNGAPLREVGLLLAYRLPEVAQQAIPGALLLGTALALTRLERDRELQAVRMAGVRLKRIVLPLIILGVLSAVVIFLLQEKVIPHCTHQAEMLFRKLVYRTPTTVVQNDVFFRVSNAYIYVGQADTQHQVLKNVIVYQRDGAKLTIYSFPWVENHEGKWIVKPDPQTEAPPEFYALTRDGEKGRLNIIYGEAMGKDNFFNLSEDIWQFMSDQPSRPEELTFAQLLALRNQVRGYSSTYSTIALPLSGNQLNFYLHRKLAVSLGGLVAVLIAIPLSVHFGRSGGFMGLLLSTGVAFFFIVSMQWTQVLAEKNLLNPVFAAWSPDVLFGMIGVVLLMREE